MSFNDSHLACKWKRTRRLVRCFQCDEGDGLNCVMSCWRAIPCADQIQIPVMMVVEHRENLNLAELMWAVDITRVFADATPITGLQS
jgi:hypothetical protein